MQRCFMLWKEKILLWYVRTLNWNESGREGQHLSEGEHGHISCTVVLHMVVTQQTVVQYLRAAAVFCTINSMGSSQTHLESSPNSVCANSGHII